LLVLSDVLFGEIAEGKREVHRTIDIIGDAGTAPRVAVR
jgi:hypothetical protein